MVLDSGVQMRSDDLAKKIGFWSFSIDVRSLLPVGWQDEIRVTAKQLAVPKTITPTSVTSREAETNLQLPTLTVGGAKLRQYLPWLDGLYRNEFRELAQRLSDEPVSCANDVRYGANLNLQLGRSMRYECHVDSNPIEGLLYVTDNPPGAGGELIVARSTEVSGINQVAADAFKIYPTAGMLVFFDAREHPHYVEPLGEVQAERIVMAMNYYTPSRSESDRPADLNRHLGLE
jgi:hypothetical protein